MAAPRLHVETDGHGPGVALAHGFGGSARNWRPQLRALRGRYRVAVYDARGHARSEAPREPEAYREPELIADLARVAATTGAARPVVGGLSLGAAVALRHALAAPERVGALVLASHPAGPGSGHGVAAHALAFADAIEREGLEAAGARFVWGPASGLAPAERTLVRQGFLEHAPHGLAHTLREFLARLEPIEALAPRLAGLHIPALVIAGARDAGSLPTSQALAAALPLAELHVIEGAGHVVNLAAPAAFDALLLDFLGRHAGGPAPRIEPRISAEAIGARLDALAGQIASDYDGAKLVLLSIAEGARRFTDDLLARLARRGVAAERLEVRARRSTGTTLGPLTLDAFDAGRLAGRDVLVLDDIADEGATLRAVLARAAEGAPRSLRTAVLIDKAERRREALALDYVGFAVERGWLVGYGMDLDGAYRELDWIGVLAEEPSASSRSRRNG
jgi:hypoxanthine phosphoribosyltransferase